MPRAVVIYSASFQAHVLFFLIIIIWRIRAEAHGLHLLERIKRQGNYDLLGLLDMPVNYQHIRGVFPLPFCHERISVQKGYIVQFWHRAVLRLVPSRAAVYGNGHHVSLYEGLVGELQPEPHGACAQGTVGLPQHGTPQPEAVVVCALEHGEVIDGGGVHVTLRAMA